MQPHSANLVNFTPPWWAERPPRAFGRGQQQFLTMNDGGHGDLVASKNSLYRGLGITIFLDLNAHARTFSVTLSYPATGQSKDITDWFESVGSRRYVAQAVIGDEDTLGFSGVSDSDYLAGVEFRIKVTTRNIRRTSNQDVIVRVREESTVVLGSPTENTDDYTMFRQFQRNRVRIWRHINVLGYDPETSEAFIMMALDPTNALAALGDIAAYLQWSDNFHGGLMFFRDFSTSLDYAFSNPWSLLPGFNPWDGETNPCVDGDAPETPPELPELPEEEEEEGE